MAATRSLSSIFRTATSRTLVSPRPRLSVPSPNSQSSSRFNPSPLRQTRIEGSVPRFLRRELSTHQPFHSVVAAACLVSKLPSDVSSYEDLVASISLGSYLIKQMMIRKSKP